MANPENVKEWLKSLISDGSNELLQKFFAEELNFQPFSIDILPVITGRISDSLKSIRIIAKQDEFYVILCVIETLLKGKERPIAEEIVKRYPHCLVIFTSSAYSEWHFTNIKYVSIGKEGLERKIMPFRRIIVGSTERLRTAAERLAMLEINDDDSAIAVHEKCNRAFNVQEVTREFYKDFVHYYKVLRDVIKNENRLTNEVADMLTQNIFNRLFFLYYIQKKNFLSENPTYLYENFKKHKGEYYKDFLLPLFKKLSDPISKDKRFEKIPFLNGGLFEFDPIEDNVSIPDKAFDVIFNELLERYNFTVREDTEFEQEIAIDPEMLGTIFEQLILGLEKADYKDIPDARRGTGSYYTPKFIVAFMVKNALLNYLVELSPDKRNNLKELVFTLKTKVFKEAELIEIKERLFALKTVDPGVGSGAFAVGLLLKMVEIIEAVDRVISAEDVEKPYYRYRLKRRIIENNIYGVDIQKRAVNLANLRLWLSLIVDLNAKEINDIPPLPNLDYQIIEGNSLVSKIGEFSFDIQRKVRLDNTGSELMDRFIRLKKEYKSIPTKNTKEAHKAKIEKTKKDLLIWFLKDMLKRKEDDLKIISPDKLFEEETIFTTSEQRQREQLRQEIESIKRHIKEADVYLHSFNWGLDFFDVIEIRQGFDIVIGNPPYGVKVSDAVKTEFGLSNKDSYGIFTALGLEILKPGGTLCYIMSDTWQTIKTHKPLRDKLLSASDCQYLISCPSDTFGATVNVGVYSFKKRLISKEGGGNWIFAADFSPLSIEKGELEAAFELLVEQDNFDEAKDGYTLWSDREMAIFAYRQKLIQRFSNHSFFIASPKLFGLMKDVGNIKNKLRHKDEPPTYTVEFNGKELELVKLGDVAEVKEGITVGENYTFIRKRPHARGNYQIIDDLLIVLQKDFKLLTDSEKRYGFAENKFDGRYFIPHDKGGGSEILDGWLPNYFVPTEYFLDWRKDSVSMMSKLKGHFFRNPAYHFKEGITFSHTGQYAPTFRIGSASIFNVESTTLFLKQSNKLENLLGVLCSNIFRYLIKNYIDNTVHASTEKVAAVSIANVVDGRISSLVSSIISHQKTNPRYDYMTNEQVEIDRLVYQMYNLNDEDIKEVENWFFRRYPKLARVIEEKMKNRNMTGDI